MADRLQAAVKLLSRRLKISDDAAGLSPARASVLATLSAGGPKTLGQLATSERVRPPTMTALVRSLESDGLVKRKADRNDKRCFNVRVTAKGKAALQRARQRRTLSLVEHLEELNVEDLRLLGEAASIIDRILGSE